MSYTVMASPRRAVLRNHETAYARRPEKNAWKEKKPLLKEKGSQCTKRRGALTLQKKTREGQNTENPISRERAPASGDRGRLNAEGTGFLKDQKKKEPRRGKTAKGLPELKDYLELKVLIAKKEKGSAGGKNLGGEGKKC